MGPFRTAEGSRAFSLQGLNEFQEVLSFQGLVGWGSDSYGRSLDSNSDFSGSGHSEPYTDDPKS